MTNYSMSENKPNIGSTNTLEFLRSKKISDLNLAERQVVAGLLNKSQFSDKLPMPELPVPGSKNYELLTEIQAVHFTYESNKKADEAWMAAMVSESPEEYVPALRHLEGIVAQINVYDLGLVEARDLVVKPENSEILNSVREKNLNADQQALSDIDLQADQIEQTIDRVARRLLRFDGIQFSLDLDKTLTESDKYLNMLPHARQFENFIDKHSRDALPFVMARYAREALIRHEKIYKKIGSTLKLRPGVEEFFENTKKQGIPLSIISANFKLIVEGCISQLPFEKRNHLLSVIGLTSNDITASDKEVVTARMVIANPQLANILCLDGLSDEGCLKGIADGISAAIFILKGTPFVEKVKNSGQPYFEFSDFHEVNNILSKILAKKESLSL